MTHAPQISYDFGNPYAVAAHRALDSGDWRAAREALLSAPRHLRTWMVAAREWGKAPQTQAVDRWRAEAPDDPWGLLYHAIVLMEQGQAARGAGYASSVGQDAFEVFFDCMRRADAELLTVAAALPTEVDPWVQLIWTGLSLQIPLEEITARFDNAQSRAPWEPVAVDATLQALCAKWSGSHEMMWGFARMVVAEAPLASPAMEALPRAHLEHVISLQSDDHPTPFALLESHDSRRELLEAAHRSVLHPDFEWDGPGILAANTFACALFQARINEETAEIFRRLGRRCSSLPWAYFSDPPQAFAYQAEVVCAREMGLPDPPVPEPWQPFTH